jgi:mannose-1-phosphate guanylyltransferase
MIDQAFILAAGYGERLTPLTDVIPKPLLPVANRPLLGLQIDYLARLGIKKLGINVHYLADKAVFYINNRFKGAEITIFHEKEKILGTGGGLGQTVSEFGSAPLLVINGDVVFEFDIQKIIAEHEQSQADVTMVLHRRKGLNVVAVKDDRVIGFLRGGKRFDGPGIENYAYTCVQIVEPIVFDYLPEDDYADIINCYQNMIKDGRYIRACVVDPPPFWTDIGSPTDYLELHSKVLEDRYSIFGYRTESNQIIDPTAVLGADVKIKGFAAIGPDVKIGTGSVIKDSIILDGARIADNTRLTRTIVGSNASADGEYKDTIVPPEKHNI